VPSLATKRYYPMGPWDDTIGVFSIGWDWNHDGSSQSSIPSPNFCKVDIMTNWDENHDLPPTFTSFNILES
jgi:hypothetical protein